MMIGFKDSIDWEIREASRLKGGGWYWKYQTRRGGDGNVLCVVDFCMYLAFACVFDSWV